MYYTKKSIVLIVSSFILTGCLAPRLNAGSPPTKEVWLDSQQHLANTSDFASCSADAKKASMTMAAQTPHTGKVFEMLGNAAQQMMYESEQMDGCMGQKGYMKFTVPFNQMPPPSPAKIAAPNVTPR